MTVTIGVLTAEIRHNNIAHGHRPPAGTPTSNTLGDYIALLHTEIAEATEAYRDWKLDDATDTRECHLAGAEICSTHHQHYTRCGGRPKPEGVGSELADILIRLLDTGDVFGFTVFDPDMQLGDVADQDPRVSDPKLPPLVSFGDHMAWLARRVDAVWTDPTRAPVALRALVTVARRYGFDLDAEYERKMAYNRTRPYRHGGRTLTEAGC